MKTLSLLSVSLLFLVSCSTPPKMTDDDLYEQAKEKALANMADKLKPNPIQFSPISHATMVVHWDSTYIYVDPIGGAAAFKDHPAPDLILVTDIHSDHLDAETIEAVRTPGTQIIVPKAVADELPEDLQASLQVLNNGDDITADSIAITAIPMYNLRKEALKYHPKGRGNGYVLEKDGRRVYISGDTEGIPEMRDLKDIDIAFVCMNLPYTMSVEDAADAVLAFKPKMVFPYHYRGEDGLSDVAKFKELVNKGNPGIQVVQLDWYRDMK